VTLLANTPAKTVGTITLGIDSDAGLFVDHSNKTEIDAIRADGRRVCEVVRLAVDDGSDSKSVLASLFASVITLCQNVYHLTDLLAEVNPRHVAFYRRVIGFAVAGTEKVCARVGAPSVLLLLPLQADGLLERVSSLSRQV
jgi:hypothetical protein